MEYDMYRLRQGKSIRCAEAKINGIHIPVMVGAVYGSVEARGVIDPAQT